MAEMNVTGTTNLNITPESEEIQVGNYSSDQSVDVDTSVNGDYDNIPIPGELFGRASGAINPGVKYRTG